MRKFAAVRMFLAVAVLPWGCADLRFEADRVPAALAIVPEVGLLTVGEPRKLEVVVLDGNDMEMPVPGWISPTWDVSDRHIAEIGQDGTVNGLHAGRVTVTARLAGLTTDALVAMNPAELLLTAPTIYLTQGAQNRQGSVRLIADRPAFLRVFMVADQFNWGFEPGIHVTLLQGDDVVFERRVDLRRDQIPTSVNESELGGSFNIEVPGRVIQPGVGMVVELDPEGLVPLAPGSRTRYPDTGSMELHVVAPQLFRQVFVPTHFLNSRYDDQGIVDWLDEMAPDGDEMRYIRKLLPVSRIEVEVRETLRTNFLGNQLFLNEIRVLHVQEGRRGYYYGVSSLIVGGLATVGAPWSVGRPEARIYAHEVGHNMNLLHADCGGPGRVDPDYPHADGAIGIWGYDLEEGVLYDPEGYKDIMSYCDPVWMSDYHFDVATTHRLNGDGGVDPDGGSSASRGKVLVVWGSVLDGELALDPAFVLEGPVELPEADGPYRLEGLGPGDETAFSLSFTPTPLDHGGGTFVFFVPWEPEWAASLDRMVLSGPEGEYTLTRDGNPEMAVVTDPSTGRIQAIVRNWDGGPLPGEETADVTISSGIPAGGQR